jgi:histidinol-phosphate aminotransferase
VLAPLRDDRYDFEAILEAITPRTKLVCLCLPNNPTGTTNTRSELDAFLEQVPEHVLTIVDQAYFEYVNDPAYPDAVEEHVKRGRHVAVLRTFSKIYGLAGLRIGYAVAPAAVCAAMTKVRRPFNLSTPAQAAALASLGDATEIERRRQLNAEGLVRLAGTLLEHGLEPVGGAVGNFLYADVGGDSTAFFDLLLREGVIVRPLHGFGAPTAVRVSVGTPEENDVFAAALGRILARAPQRRV